MERNFLSRREDRNREKSPKSTRKVGEKRVELRPRARRRRPDHPTQITFFFMTFFTLTVAFFADLSSSDAIRWPQAQHMIASGEIIVPQAGQGTSDSSSA